MKSLENWLGLADLDRTLRPALDLASGVLGAPTEVFVVRVPGRINLMGMHIDHRGGSVNPIAIKDVFLVVRPRDDDLVRAFNVESSFPQREFSIPDISPPRGTSDWDSWTHGEHQKRERSGTAGDWSNYIQAPLAYIRFNRPDTSLRGMDIFVSGNIPKASGLSSSSTLVVGAAMACNEVNDLGLDKWKLVEVCGTGEWYVGTRGGSGDHAAIIFGKLDHISHLGSLPLTVDHVSLPAGYSVVLANSLVEAKKTENARDVFNQRVACYEVGLLLLKARDDRILDRAEFLRDVNPQTLQCSRNDIYRLLKLLPEKVERDDIRRMLPEEKKTLERVFRTHEDIGPYRLRNVIAFGITECIRSEMAFEALGSGDVDLFGELINISHDGDRVTWPDSSCGPEYSDSAIDSLVAERTRLWRLPGRYDVSCPELDRLVDIARGCDGVAGAGRVGAGLGGAMTVLVESDSSQALLDRLACEYYEPSCLPPSAEVVRPLDGAGIVDCAS